MEPTTGHTRQTVATLTGQSWKNRKQTATVFTTTTRQCLQSAMRTQMYLQEETEAQLQFLTQMAMK